MILLNSYFQLFALVRNNKVVFYSLFFKLFRSLSNNQKNTIFILLAIAAMETTKCFHSDIYFLQLGYAHPFTKTYFNLLS